ncbi:MAG: sigma-54-dependent Fis family transcriptional regulator [Bacteroidaceae bacterium]|nr:sigma-54-dependent Fis family transcriptional regulator [Bacteroidaceae bacterium]
MNESALKTLKQRYDIVGNNAALNRALDIALQVAATDLTVLITGENGVGKEVFPRVIHDNSTRRGKKYFAVNCGSIPEGTIDAELFGHEKGAFTGAIGEREGYFGAASGGTLFLDEVGELPLSTQARLLRVLETGEYIRVGASEVRHTDVRIVAATNLNIPKAISEGRFREDLYYRLNTIPISIPPLRDRGEDIVLLFRKFALNMSEKYRMPPVRLNEAAKQMLMAYSWPGNVRQLKNVTENMSVTSEQREITPEIMEQYIPRDSGGTQLVPLSEAAGAHSYENERDILYKILFDLRRDVTELKRLVGEKHQSEAAMPSVSSHLISGGRQEQEQYVEDVAAEPVSMEDLEREAIRKALERNRGARRDTSHELGISERTLYRKIKEYGLEDAED